MKYQLVKDENNMFELTHQEAIILVRILFSQHESIQKAGFNRVF